MSTLAELVQDLPLELFDEIKALTFTVDGDDVIEITKHYKPPVQLQIDRASRASFAEKYYAAKSFFLIRRTRKKSKLATKWLESLSAKPSEPLKKLCFRSSELCSFTRSPVMVGASSYYKASTVIKMYERYIRIPMLLPLPSSASHEPQFWTAELDVGAILADV